MPTDDEDVRGLGSGFPQSGRPRSAASEALL